MDYNEYRGISNLVVAALTEAADETGKVTATYSKPIRLAGVQSVSKEVSESSEPHYYDNVPAIVVDSEGQDTYTLTVSLLEAKTRALIEGTTYDEKTGAIIGTPKQKKYFALGFIADTVAGKKIYNWIYKGKFTGGNEEHNSKNDGTDANNVEYTYTSINTSETSEKTGGKTYKYLSVEDNDKVDLSKFFDQVTKPDDLVAKA